MQYDLENCGRTRGQVLILTPPLFREQADIGVQA